ncbi:MAG: hypothetical protein LBM77_03085 [Spirochaetaceae bacterium]|jgi:hypothetical protein|nr:hypothetical protein [Spirochaetaceae bacterium]
MKDKLKVKGMVTVSVFDSNGNIKRRAPNWLQRIFGLPGSVMVRKHHNIVTREGDALIADALLGTPTKAKVAGTTGYMQVGNGWTGTDTKNTKRCVKPTGSMKVLDSGYPQKKAAWGSTGDTTVVYRTTFAAGNLNANGINECCLLNGNAAASNALAYAQVTPSVNVTTSDTLQIVWELTILGQ